jgi:glyoxylase-like metal-dependent hydrolase (beta-lactamase superfamily II)
LKPSKYVERLLCEALISACAWSCAAMSAPPEPAALRVDAGVYVLPGTGGDITSQNGGRVANVAFIAGPDGVIVVDTGISYRQGEAIIAAVESVARHPIRLAILTHPGQEAIFGAAAFQARGIPVLAHRRAADLIAARCETCLRNLRSTLGDEAMEATLVAKPDRLIDGDERLELIGRPVRIIAPSWSSSPGAIAVFDESSSTLIAGDLVSIHRIPNLRDANPQAWRGTLDGLAALRCRHLVPGYGPVATCADIVAFARYFGALETRVDALLKAGVGLAELRARSELPEFAAWDQYEALHAQNASYVYLRLERKQFEQENERR